MFCFLLFFSLSLTPSLFYPQISPETPEIPQFSQIQRASYTLEAIAEDRGSPSLSRTVEVQVEVVDRSNKPPVWDNLERISRAVYVKENTAVGETVTTVRARSANPLFFGLPSQKCQQQITKSLKITLKSIECIVLVFLFCL